MLNDNCPFSLWIVIVAAATISVHGGQLSLMDSYRCYSALWNDGKIAAFTKFFFFFFFFNRPVGKTKTGAPMRKICVNTSKTLSGSC